MFAISGSSDYALLSFYKPVNCLSWAPFDGGCQSNISYIINRTLPKGNLSPMEEIVNDLKVFITDLELNPSRTVAMVTTASQKYLGAAYEQSPTGLKAWCASTVGLGNVVAPGEHTAYDEELGQAPAPAGTINLVVSVNRNLSPGAALELSNTISLAKAAVMADLNLTSKRNGKLCLATGTDCNIVCWDPSSNITLRFAGLHTRLAELVANAVRNAMVKSLSTRLDTPYITDTAILRRAHSRFTATR